MSRRGWWRENRFWLPALPVAMAAMLAASAYNVRYFWYEQGLHHELAAASPGEPLTVEGEYDDYLGATTRTFRVRLDEIATVDSYPFDDEPAAPPPGTRAVSATLDWEAEPDQVLRGCTVTLVDSEGRRYEVLGGVVHQCVPEGQEGPLAPTGEGQERGEVPLDADRPRAWSTSPTFLVAEDAEITRVLVWWQLPDYVELSAP